MLTIITALRNMKVKQTSLLLLSIVIISSVIVIVQNKKNPTSATCNSISADQAIDIAKQLPEVKSYLGRGTIKSSNQISKATIDVDSETAVSYTIHVYSNEQYLNDPEMAHKATFNWYTVDKCTGKIKCSFSIYDDAGKIIRASNGDEYPCD